MHKRLAGLLFTTAVLAAAISPMAAAPASAEAGPPPGALVSNDGQVVDLVDVLPEGAGDAFRPDQLVEDLDLGQAAAEEPPAPTDGGSAANSVIGAGCLWST